MGMITDPNMFFTDGCGRCERFATPDCSARLWIDGLNALRHICGSMGLRETVKWAHPCYTHAERNIALLLAFKADFRLGFMNPGLLRDSDNVLELSGPNSLTPSMIRFSSAQQVEEMEPTVRAYLRQLMGHAEAGTKEERVAREIDIPEELTDALDADPELAEAFSGLTPGRQRSYMFNLNQAKHSATRVVRIEKFRQRILAGKGLLEQ